MLVKSWYPYLVFKLSFGWKDSITDYLVSIDKQFSEDLQSAIVSESKIRQILCSAEIDDGLTQYVPFRLIRPFFPELRGIQDHKVNNEVKILADNLFESRKPLYKFSQNSTAILVHPDWCSYIQSNYQLVRGWVAWRWLQYMQIKNPNTPAIANKLFPPKERQSLHRQTKYWRRIIELCQDVRCIYSGKLLSFDGSSLDHYLPWSFVAHDQLWNLVPTSKAINSSKSNRIPDNTYFDNLVTIQHLGLTVFCSSQPQKIWGHYIEDYWIDLGLSSLDDLLSLECLRNRYELKVKPLIALAISQGFEYGWQCG
ncbi:HNH endonuclease domain-containing protein [Synechococcus elongatus]|uniref:HNH endonuclease domain-containing protein n=1 Tax=Synechococcus elongatus TaxID=32046 RepID=UPI0030CB1FDD